MNLPRLSNRASPKFGPEHPWLAPLAGYSDLPFRLLCSEFGAATCETEMVSAKGLCHSGPGSTHLLRNSSREAPLVVQLFGSDPGDMAKAAQMLRRSGWLWFDCNLGCPVKKVMRQGAGAALLSDPDRVIAIARSMLAAVSETGPDWDCPDEMPRIGFKLRLGVDCQHKVLPDLALRLEDAGAAWLTLHPRYASDGFSGNARWEEIARLARRVSIPLLASGDMTDARQGRLCLAQTGATGIMYARGALYDPAIFASHKAAQAGLPVPANTPQRLKTTIEKHICYARQVCDDQRSFNKMRSIIPRYVRHLPGVGDLRRALCACENWDEMQLALENFIRGSKNEDSAL